MFWLFCIVYEFLWTVIRKNAKELWYKAHGNKIKDFEVIQEITIFGNFLIRKCQEREFGPTEHEFSPTELEQLRGRIRSF